MSEDIYTRLDYEFTKAFLISAEAAFQSLEGPSTTSKYGAEAFQTAGNAVGLLFGSTAGKILGSPKYIVRPFDEINQKLKQKLVFSTIQPPSSKDFKDTFRKLFVQTGLLAFYTFDLQSHSSYSRIYLKVGFGKNKKEDARQAIQILGTYAGACCFEYLMENGTKETILEALSEKSILGKVKSMWKSWTEENLRVILRSSGEKKKTSAYNFFLKRTAANTESMEISGQENASDCLISKEFIYSMESLSLAERVYSAILKDQSYSMQEALLTKVEDILVQGKEHLEQISQLKDKIDGVTMEQPDNESKNEEKINISAKDVITAALDYLCTNTQSVEVILDKLFTMAFITETQIPKILFSRTAYLKNYELYNWVLKIEMTLEVLYSVLRTTGNDSVALYLEQQYKILCDPQQWQSNNKKRKHTFEQDVQGTNLTVIGRDKNINSSPNSYGDPWAHCRRQVVRGSGNVVVGRDFNVSP